MGGYPQYDGGLSHLIYKHFTKYFSRSGLEKVDDDVRSSTHIQTSIWPISNQELETLAFQSLKGAKKVDPYSFRLALTSFGDRSFEGNVNLIADLDQSNGLGTPCDSFQVTLKYLSKSGQPKRQILFPKNIYLLKYTAFFSYASRVDV